jgi:aromatic-L-amino-acid/L-tryptophan decarboxylase
MLVATLGAQCMLWQTSPAATELETRVMQWLGGLLQLPTTWDGVIQDSASSATLCAALCARERSIAWQGNAEGLGGQPAFRAYATAEVHSSIPKALRIAGYGDANLVQVKSDRNRAMCPEALRRAIANDRANGMKPALVVACIGSTGVGACDRLEPLGEVCRDEGLYFHVDAAWAGSALISSRYRPLAKGIERADSFVFNPHKWLLTNFDCSAHFVRDRKTLLKTLAILPAYLNSNETGTVIDYRDWSIPLGRRFRALKLWFVLRSYGAKHLRQMVENHVDWTHELAERIEAHPDFELVDGPRLALLNFRFKPHGYPDDGLDALNAQLREDVNAAGSTYVTGNVVDGKATIRFAVGQATTTRAHVFAAWSHICSMAQDRIGKS